MATEFKIPNLGENVTAGDVLRVMVKPGDTLAKEQPVLELETDKATIEVPSSVAGKISEIRVKEGDKVTVGQVVLLVEEGGAAEAPAAASAGASNDAKAESGAAAAKAGGGERAAAKPADAGEEAAQGGQQGGRAGKAAADGEKPDAAAARKAGADADEADEEGDEEEGDEPEEGEGLRQRAPGTVRAAAATDKPGEVDEEDAAPSRAARGASRGGPAEVVDISRGVRAAAAAEAAPARDASRIPAPAAPSVRRIARELGIDINVVPGSGPGGRISADDVIAYGKRIITAASSAAPGRVAGPAIVTLPDFEKWGSVERKPLRGVRRKTAEHLTTAWTTIPHVTQCDKADITALEELRGRYGKRAEAAGGKLTVTAIALKVIATALKVFPQFNASIDMAGEELIYKKYIHVGVAVDTDRGLLVPVIRDVDKKNIIELAGELAQAAEKARSQKLTLEEMEGGCFTITNLGGIGGTYFTPIVNHPEVAILGMSRAQTEPVYIDGAFQPRLRLPLSLSYDHRVIDGADAIRFLRFVVEALEQPFVLSLQG